MKTIIRDATATVTLHEAITVEVPDDFTPQEIQRALKQEADFVFGQDVQLSNGLELDIEFDDSNEEEPQIGDLFDVKVSYHNWEAFRVRAEDAEQAIAFAKRRKNPYDGDCYDDDGEAIANRVE